MEPFLRAAVTLGATACLGEVGKKRDLAKCLSDCNSNLLTAQLCSALEDTIEKEVVLSCHDKSN